MALTTDEIQAINLSLPKHKQYTQAFAISPSNTNFFATSQDKPLHCNAIWSGAGGTVTVVFADDPTSAAIQFTLAANTIYPFALKRVNSTGTAATGLIGLI